MDYEKLHKDTIAKLQEMVNSGKITAETACGICADFVPESKDEMIRKSLAAYFAKFKPDDMWDADFSFGDIVVWFEKQSKKPDTDFSDLRTWKYIVDAVLTEKEGIGQYLDSPLTEEVAKKLQKRFGNTEQILANSAKTCKDEQKPAEWHREDEQNLNACLGYIQDEFLRRWLTDIVHVKYDKSVELPKGEDYGIDGLYAAIDILQKTLGEVDGYQSDDGILEHKCAISVVKELSKQQKPWSEEDETGLTNTIIMLKEGASLHFNKNDITKAVNFLRTLKERYTWNQSDLPHWKKSTLPNDNTTGFNSDYFCHKGYNINYKELFEKLPKDD